jgi:subtilisin-like proprotein convertase family protein
MFDVSASSDVMINSFDVNLDSGTYDVEVYYKMGTWVGSDTTPGDWTLLDTATGVVSAGTDNPTSLGLSLGLNVMSGDTVAFYVVSTSGGWNYTNGTAVGNVWFSDSNLTVYEGAGKEYPWGSTFSPRNFNGNIHYDAFSGGSGPTMTFDCSYVGANTVSLIVADDAGNTATCTANITVEDNQAPVVICKGGGGVATVEEMFEGASVPADWSTEVVSGAWDWTFGSNVMPGTDDFPTNAAIFDDDAAGSTGVQNVARLYSPMANISSAVAANLSFDYALGDFAGSGILIVEVWDGSAWMQVFTADNADIPPTSSGVIDVLSYANADFQVRFTYDDENAGWNWGAGVDNFVMSYDLPPTPPLEVVLDADGMATVDLNDLLYSVEDNCGVSVALGGNIPTACEQSNASNGFENGYFTDPGSGFIVANDITLDPGMDFTLDHIQANLFHDVGATISSVDITYYEDAGGQPGTEIGYDFGVAPVAQTVVGNNFGYDVSSVDFDVTPFALTGQAGASTTYWVSMVVSSSVGGVTAWELSTASTNGYESLSFDGATWNGGSGDGVYVFSGMCTGGVATSLDVDCSMLGENMVDVIVTDAGGNEASCTATVMVLDETAPVLECGPEPTLYDMGMASIEPGLTIDTNGSDVVVTSVLTVTEDHMIDDLNVPVNISHTWIGDIYMTLTSPMGTTVVLHNMSGGSAQDIVVTYDDEGTPAAEALSAFDGESTMGDWTLYIEDTWPGLDGGMLNSWGIEFEYSYPNPETDLFIELGPDGTVSITPEDITYVMDEACGFDVVLLDITDFDCSNIGTPTLVTLFANDTSGNFASCQVEVNIVDTMAPTLTCTPEHGGAFDPVTGFYELPDYVAQGDVAATDNCTLEGDIVYTQDPAPGTMLTPTTETTPHIVTATATDEYGNVSTCTFEVYVRNTGVAEDTALSEGVNLYPNPATTEVTLSNTSQIAIHTAEIYDVNGKLVRSFTLTSDVSTLDVSDLSSGIFMVKVIGDEASTVEQLVKK